MKNECLSVGSVKKVKSKYSLYIMFKSQINSLQWLFYSPTVTFSQLPCPTPLPSVPSCFVGGGFVLAVLRHLHQLVDGVQQAVAVLPQQPLVEPLVPEAHLQQHGHHGGVLPGGWVDASLGGTEQESE